MTILEYFDTYTAAGLRIIPLYPSSKIPIQQAWNRNWNRERAREYFEKDPSRNMGLLLGELVDAEGDTEEANKLLDELIGNYPHPMYRSAKSVHHLFINPDSNLTKISVNGLEFRGHNHQSVLPPSVHESGEIYVWLEGTKFPPPQMPHRLLDYYLTHRPDKKSVQRPKKRGPVKTGYTRTVCKVCGRKEEIHKHRLALEVKVFESKGMPWHCHGCRKIDVREDCRQLRRLLASPVPFITKDRPKKVGGDKNVLAG